MFGDDRLTCVLKSVHSALIVWNSSSYSRTILDSSFRSRMTAFACSVTFLRQDDAMRCWAWRISCVSTMEVIRSTCEEVRKEETCRGSDCIVPGDGKRNEVKGEQGDWSQRMRRSNTRVARASSGGISVLSCVHTSQGVEETI